MRYRKKPIVIEAMKFDGLDSYMAINEWARSHGVKSDREDGPASTPSLEELFRFETPIMLVRTLEGTMAASRGDWIIRGVKGEFYPCKPDIFEASYEAVCSVCDEPDHSADWKHEASAVGSTILEAK